MERFESSIDKLIDSLVLQIPHLIAAFVILIVGRYVIRFSLNLIEKRFERRDVDMSIRSFIKSLIKFALYCLLILTVASTLGIQTTSFIAALSAFGLAVGMALQGSLSNFAGGVLILIFRPFEVGDYVSSDNGSEGTIEQIDILYTTMVNADGIRVFSPNGTLANSVIKNYTRILSRRFQFVVGISYDDNIKDAKDAIMQVLTTDKRVEKKPLPEVFVSELADSSVNLTVRGWAHKDKFWDTNNSLQEMVKVALDEKGISIPYPQTEMRIKSGDIDRDNRTLDS
ncbi:mechanosensitive ion channel family protein [Sphingobacterium sp. UT-1RO-CII-1]|uniref:mechanosensitive ion channel family protein n=1 Tax=Sphingobacterium sp. UT-1RO-CII-1 TaxID=2995225 RepID=UPI00227BB790|nr:mechanosensitive ion channel family protein [Sphingobacterium sp. UT-1RO-CII-1]MCY4781284.1 mechanosensitive ion channel family protein [Sphingobacterium sp. UT-1RO-CII-1]